MSKPRSKRNQQDRSPQDEERRRNRDDRGGNRSGNQGRRPPQRQGGPRDAQAPPSDRGARRPQQPACELIIADEGSSASAPVFRADVPPEWHEIPPIAFFKSGIFVRAQGAVKQAARDLKVDRAVAYAIWEDPAALFTFEGRKLRPGVTCAFLIPSDDAEGPPWIPMQASVSSGQAEMDSGILSPWLDQAAPIAFRPELSLSRKRLVLSTDTRVEMKPDREALEATLRWLVENPGVDNPLARLTRVMLVDNGHGLQRFGVSLMGRDDEARTRAIDEILVPLAPEVGALVKALWETWRSPRELLESEGLSPALRALAEAVNQGLAPTTALNRPSSMALLVSWMAGLFGIRPERSGRQPARSLFALVRALRRSGRQLKALRHVDSPLPRFPIDRAENNDLIRELSRRPRQETDFETLVRALAIAEVTGQMGAPWREHLRPFRTIYPKIRAYPNGGRTLIGRFDYVFSRWSFRGAELRDRGLNEGALAGVFITQSPSITASRTFARVVASATRAGELVAMGLRSLPDTPSLTLIGSFAEKSIDEVVALYDEAAGHDKTTRLRLVQGIAAAEYLIARSEVDEAAQGVQLRPPALPDDPEGGIRSHFMYWRMYCRAIAWKLPDTYADFVSAMGPQAASLPMKLQTELLALARRWSVNSDANREVAKGWATWLSELGSQIFEGEGLPYTDGEWLENLVGALAVADPAATGIFLERLIGDPGFDVAGVDRILDAIRGAGWLGELSREPVFKALFQRIVERQDVAGTRARVEWTRAAIDRARHRDAVRWLLDDRAYPRTLSSADFERWFKERAPAAIDAPDDAVIELLEVAVRHIAPTHLDLVLRALDANTLWPQEQHLALLRESGRPAGVCTRLRMAPLASESEYAEAVAALFEAQGGEDLRQAAVALSHFVEKHGETETAAILRDGLAGSYGRYKPFRYALDGFIEALSGWEIAGLELREPAPRLAENAARWALETGAWPLAAFVGSLADRAALSQLAPALETALAGEPDALLQALVALEFPAALLPAFHTASSGSRGPANAMVRGALAGKGAAPLLDAALAGALESRLAVGASAEDLEAQLRALAKALDAGLPGEEAEADEDESAAPLQDAAEAQDAPEVAQIGDDEEDAPEASTEGLEPVPNSFAQRWRETLRKALLGASRSWADRLSRMGPLGEVTRELLRGASRFSPAFYALRSELFASLGGLRDDFRELHDPRRLLTTDFSDGDRLAVDAQDFALIVDTLRRIAVEHGASPSVTVGLRELGIVLPKKAKAAEGAAATQDELEAEAPEAADLDAESDSEAGEAADEAANEAVEAGEAEAATDALTLLKEGLAGDASLELRSTAWGEPGIPLMLRHLAKRNDLTISTGALLKRQGLLVRWGQRRRS